MSGYGLAENLGRGWEEGGGARRSVIIGNGAGGFLAVPVDDGASNSGGRLGSAGSGSGRTGGGFLSPNLGPEQKRRGSQYDMWR
jgi:hypothetical protein